MMEKRKDSLSYALKSKVFAKRNHYKQETIMKDLFSAVILLVLIALSDVMGIFKKRKQVSFG